MAEIKTRPATPEYRENWEKIFRKTKLSADEWREQYQQQPIDGDAVYWAQSKRVEETGNA